MSGTSMSGAAMPGEAASGTSTGTLLSRDQAAEILAGVRPGARVVDVVRCDGGRISGAYEARCADPADSVIFKLYAPDAGWRLGKELSVYRLLAAGGVTAIPELLHADRAEGPLGRPFLVMAKLAGRPAQAVEGALTPAESAEVYRQMGELLAAIHRVEQDAFGYRTTEILDPVATNAAFLTRLVAEKLARSERFDGDRELYDAVERYVAERTELFDECVGPRLVHNDFHAGNVLVDRTPDGLRLSGCVDVENALAGDPLVDLAKLDMYSIRGDEAKFAGLVDGYGALPAGWRDRFALYRVVHSVELWDWFRMTGERERLRALADDLRTITSAR